MTANVLVAYDGSPLSERALTYAIETFPDAPITAIYVINPIGSVIDVEVGGLPVAEDWYENAKKKQPESTRRPRTSRRNGTPNSIPLRKSATRYERSSNTLTTTTPIRSSWAVTADQASTVRSSAASPRQSPAEHESR